MTAPHSTVNTVGDETFRVAVDGIYTPTLNDLKARGLPDDYTADDLRTVVTEWWFETQTPARFYIEVARQVAFQQTLPGVEPVTHKVTEFVVVTL